MSPQSESASPSAVQPEPMYRKPQVLDRRAHAQLRFAPVANYGFAEQQGTCPVVLSEFVDAAAHYPLVFVPNAEGVPMPVASTGLGLARNDFVAGDGQWRKGAYVPAYVRRYPFTFANLATADQPGESLALCADMAAPHFSDDGVPLFEAQGDAPSVADRALAFCNRFQQSHRVTVRMAERLAALGLFSERQFRVSFKDEARRDTVIKGCLIVDEAKLKALDDSAFLALRQDGYLPGIYAHLGSLRRLVALATGATPTSDDPVAKPKSKMH